MQTIITYPLIRDENGDIELFLSAESLLANVEVADVDNCEYQVFDASGQCLCLVSEASTRRILGIHLPSRRPVLRLSKTRTIDPEDARTRFIRWLRIRGVALNKETTESLCDIVKRCLQILRNE